MIYLQWYKDLNEIEKILDDHRCVDAKKKASRVRSLLEHFYNHKTFETILLNENEYDFCYCSQCNVYKYCKWTTNPYTEEAYDEHEWNWFCDLCYEKLKDGIE